MIGVVIAALMLGVLVYVVKLTSVPGRDDRMMRLMVAGYLARLFIQLFSRDLALFSHGGGGDYVAYEIWAVEITRTWQFSGFEFITQDVMPELGFTSLPSNLFALIVALNGGDPSPFGCTAVVACLACLSTLNIYLLAVELGAEPRRSLILVGVLLFSPAFLLYTSDMYKDGLVIFAVTTAIGSSIRLARKFSILHLVLGGLSLWALWYIRYYLVFVSTAPLFVGLTGLRDKSTVRPVLVALLMAAAFVVVVGATDVLDTVADQATTTFAHGTAKDVKDANASQGSGVTFDDGGNPLAAMGPKLAYQLFAPFPWAGGSVGFHIGKLDAFIWYYVMYRAWKAARVLWRTERAALLMLMTFIVPTSFMYATSFANVGLSLRQRMVVVMVTGILAALSWPAEKRLEEDEPTEAKGPGRTPTLGPAFAARSRRA